MVKAPAELRLIYTGAERWTILHASMQDFLTAVSCELFAIDQDGIDGVKCSEMHKDVSTEWHDRA